MDRGGPCAPRWGQRLADRAPEAVRPPSLDGAPGWGWGQEKQDGEHRPPSRRPHQHVVWAESRPRWPATWTWPSTPWTSRSACSSWRAVSASGRRPLPTLLGRGRARAPSGAIADDLAWEPGSIWAPWSRGRREGAARPETLVPGQCLAGDRRVWSPDEARVCITRSAGQPRWVTQRW